MNFDLYYIVTQVVKLLRKDELAYLAVTGKIENLLRDKIAFLLHEEYGGEYLICREWKGSEMSRTDISIIDFEKKPRCLIELKAQSTPTNEVNRYKKFIEGDLKKMYKEANYDTQLFYVFLNNFLVCELPFDKRYSSSIKYWNKIQVAHKKNISAQILDNIRNNWIKCLSENGLDNSLSKEVRIEGGSYYDFNVSVIAFIYGPFTKPSLNLH